MPQRATSGRSPIYVIAGEEGFLRREALAKLTAELSGGAANSWGIAEYDGTDEPEPATVLDDVRTPTLLASQRLVIMRRADDFIADHHRLLKTYFDAPCDCGVLVMECEKFLSTSNFYKAVAAAGGLISCKSLRPSDVPVWVTARVSSAYQRRMPHEAARTLVELVGTSLDRLDAELGKLATYVGSRETIDASDIADMVGATRMEKVFIVTDAIAQRDARGALEHWDQVLANDKSAEFSSVGGMAWGLRRLVQARRILDAGGSPADLMSLRMNFDQAKLVAAQVRRLTLSQWEDMLLRLLKIELAGKSGGGDVAMGIEKLIVEYAAAV